MDESYLAEMEDTELQIKVVPRERGQFCEVASDLGPKDRKGLVIQRLGKE